MSPLLSTYLDLVRFAAALIVFLGHASGQLWTGGFLWPLSWYMDTSVVVFFVLSGYVIAWIADTRETNWRSFLASRAGRLWSVVIPALALTFLVDQIGLRVAPELYIGRPWYPGDHEALRYLMSLLMLQHIWHADLTPGINGPFWSLTYEAFYYAAFGVLTFAQGRWRGIAIVLLMAIGGPTVIALAPLWAIGVLAYRFSVKGSLSILVAWIAAVSGAGLLLLSPVLRGWLPWNPLILGEEILPRYIDALAFSIHLLGVIVLLRGRQAAPVRLRSFIVVVAGMTFPLYLFHRPLLQFFSYMGPEDAGSFARRIFVVGGTLAVVHFATPACDRLRDIIRRSVFARLEAGIPVRV